jgi:hypothetical protein
MINLGTGRIYAYKIELQPRRERHLVRWEEVGADLHSLRLPELEIVLGEIGGLGKRTIHRDRWLSH